jgi:chromosome segregation ATPase
MNDYIIDERLIREFKEVTSSKSHDPTPYPEKSKKMPSNFSSMQISSNATFKKEINDMEHKFKNLEKTYNKLLKKHSDVQEDMKVLKTTNDALTKELNILQISNEKILGEKLNLESQLEENKSYTRKLESRLVQGAKNQYLVEINNKLRKEVEDIKKLSEDKLIELEKIRNDINKKNQEIKILHKALVKNDRKIYI